jgi:hypothetical protein
MIIGGILRGNRCGIRRRACYSIHGKLSARDAHPPPDRSPKPLNAFEFRNALSAWAQESEFNPRFQFSSRFQACALLAKPGSPERFGHMRLGVASVIGALIEPPCQEEFRRNYVFVNNGSPVPVRVPGVPSPSATVTTCQGANRDTSSESEQCQAPRLRRCVQGSRTAFR